MRICEKLIVASLVLAVSLAGQETRGRVQGDVRDPSGAVVPGANVTLSNDETGVRAVNPTNDRGHYIFDLVVPGHYTVTVETPGFRAFVQKNVLVEVGGDVTANAAMEVESWSGSGLSCGWRLITL